MRSTAIVCDAQQYWQLGDAEGSEDGFVQFPPEEAAREIVFAVQEADASAKWSVLLRADCLAYAEQKSGVEQKLTNWVQDDGDHRKSTRL